ncbi:hypothetical protein L5515_010089 [Caenorhabditis briggsae]|uniref:Uncharacterized protein n=2 Tax=Caenorhabditis briggsae TaxID=6238 RepID=A0AAE9ER04_CAEBR|nr:hypothetical protein L5515_010089 [Caenorhabditis briggsae]
MSLVLPQFSISKFHTVEKENSRMFPFLFWKTMRILTFLFGALVFANLYAWTFAAQEMDHSDWKRDPPSRVLSLLTAQCIKHEESCQSFVQMNIIKIEDLIKLLATFKSAPEAELIDRLTYLADEIEMCKDAECVQDFEIKNGRKFEMAMFKARSIVRASQEMSNYADEHRIFVDSEIFN